MAELDDLKAENKLLWQQLERERQDKQTIMAQLNEEIRKLRQRIQQTSE